MFRLAPRERADMYAERWLYGRQRIQPLFERLHMIALRGLGYDEGNPAINGEYRMLREVAATLRADAVVFDVGAFHGDWSLAALAQMPNARVHTFEPVPASYRVLTERLDGRARLYNLAIGAQDGTMPISGGEYLPMASLSRKDAPVIATVDVRRLDTVCAEQGIDRIDVLKIDTEGHELAVLQGAGNLLTERRIGLIQFETGGTQIHARTYADDFFALLEPAGYRIYRLLRDGLTPLKHDGHYEIFAYANLVAVPLS